MVVMLNSVENCNQYNLWCSAWRILDWQYFKCNWSCASAHFDQQLCVQVDVEEVMRALFGHTVSCHLWEECIVCSLDRGCCKRSTGMTGLVWMQCEQLFFFFRACFLHPYPISMNVAGEEFEQVMSLHFQNILHKELLYEGNCYIISHRIVCNVVLWAYNQTAVQQVMTFAARPTCDHTSEVARVQWLTVCIAVMSLRFSDTFLEAPSTVVFLQIWYLSEIVT